MGKIADELKPCPFCYGKPTLHQPRAALGAWISCEQCGLEGPTETGVTEVVATAHWNTRAALSASDALTAGEREPVAWTSQGQLAAVAIGSVGSIFREQSDALTIALYLAPPAPDLEAQLAEVKEALTAIDGLDVMEINPSNYDHDDVCELNRNASHASVIARDALSALEATPPAPAGQPVTLTYKNWRGEVAERTITPKRIWFGSTDWHPEPQWLLTAFDAEKQADRDFALKDFGATPPAPKVTEEADLWTGEGDGFKSFTHSAKVAERWRKGSLKVTPYAALSGDAS